MPPVRNHLVSEHFVTDPLPNVFGHVANGEGFPNIPGGMFGPDELLHLSSAFAIAFQFGGLDQVS
jgi:hypothetical protein